MKISKMTALFDNGLIGEYAEKASAQKQYYFIRQDDQIDPKLYERIALNRPMVFRLETHRTIRFTKELQEYCFSLNRSDDERRDRHAFADLYDTWSTNTGKIRDNANYINYERIGSDDPKWTNLVMGRNVICGEEIISDGTFGIKKELPCLKVSTLSSSSLPAGLTYETHPEFIHHCTIINSATWDGLCKVLPFPQMGGKVNPPMRPVFYPLMWDTDVYIPMYMLIKLPLGSKIPNPYNPAWEW